MIQLDDWQKDFIACKTDKILVSGRQTGKTEAQAYDNVEFALEHSGVNCLIISKTERQAEELLLKCVSYLSEKAPKRIGRGKLKTLKNRCYIMHGKSKPSRIMCLPVGIAGEGIRGYTIHKLSVDEAQLVNDDVFAAVTPMLLTTGGKISMSGTPKGKIGYFWKAYQNKDNIFKVFHVNSEDVLKNRKISESWKEWQKEAAVKHLIKERARMSEKEYAQEYLGVFVEDLMQFFSDELIKKCCILKRKGEKFEDENFMGCDIARFGGDEITYEIFHRFGKENIQQCESIVKRYQRTTDTENDIIQLTKAWNVNKVGIDAGSGALGVGIYDRFLASPDMKRKVVAMNNRKVSMTRDGKSSQRIFKEDMYENLLSMMERGEILLLDDDEIQASLKSIQQEIVEGHEKGENKLRIFGSYSHIVEGIIRAVWLAKKEKVIKLDIRYF